tara:strand:+ start:359 stop:595 length:237 start_codon:yes stop_codon:yes gene_type:complete
MGDITYIGYNRINRDTDIDGDFIVSGSALITESLLIAGSEPVTFGTLQKMLVTEDTTSILDFNFISTSTGEVVIYEAV